MATFGNCLAEEGSMASALSTVAILTDTPEENYDRPGEERPKPALPGSSAKLRRPTVRRRLPMLPGVGRRSDCRCKAPGRMA